jgi:hypothetical protein
VLFLSYIIVTFLFHEVSLSLGYNMSNTKGEDRDRKAVDKSPVHTTVIPRTDNESGKKSHPVQDKDAKELRGAVLTMNQAPNYQVPIKLESTNEADKSEETKERTAVTHSLKGKTILKQDQTAAQPTPKSEDKEKETLVVQSKMSTESEVGKQGLDVQEVGASRKGPSVDSVEAPSKVDYVYPFTFAIAIWQDFALSAANKYNEFARELARLHSNWMDIFLNVWQTSDHEEKRNKGK